MALFDLHTQHMKHALLIAENGLGRVWPNPSVGAVIVKDGKIVGIGRTADSGRPHAETIALEMAGANALGADMYVTLEPCCNHGKTPPCVNTILNAGIKRVIIATHDPSEKVNGEGMEYLRKNGIEVLSGVMEEQARLLNAGFIKSKTLGMPLVTLKIATSRDGKIGLKPVEAGGLSKPFQISDEPQIRSAHLLRATHDAVLTGVGTVLSDDPYLTCRLSGMIEYTPVRVILDSNLRTPLESNLVKTALQYPVWILCAPSWLESESAKNLEKRGCKIIGSDNDNLPNVLRMLADLGITRLLVEGGGQIITSFISQNLVDDYVWFTGSSLLGRQGLDAYTGEIINIQPEQLTKCLQE
jgi:diaminohydroxyphosphoribosylaminopyrimidine deaminase/5-amino-6-(5-phosphoribosylamino)uracil reductase